MAILSIIEKLLGFGIDLFVRHQAERDKLKRDLEAFFKRSSNDSKESAELYQKYRDIKKDQVWKKKG